jgi:hypothetical protein
MSEVKSVKEAVTESLKKRVKGRDDIGQLATQVLAVMEGHPTDAIILTDLSKENFEWVNCIMGQYAMSMSDTLGYPFMAYRAGVAVPYSHFKSRHGMHKDRVEQPTSLQYDEYGKVLSFSSSLDFLGDSDLSTSLTPLTDRKTAERYPIETLMALYAMRWPSDCKVDVKRYLMSQPAVRSRSTYMALGENDETRTGLMQTSAIYNFQQMSHEEQEKIIAMCQEVRTAVAQLESVGQKAFDLPATRHLMLNGVLKKIMKDQKLVVPANIYGLVIDPNRPLPKSYGVAHSRMALYPADVNWDSRNEHNEVGPAQRFKLSGELDSGRKGGNTKLVPLSN